MSERESVSKNRTGRWKTDGRIRAVNRFLLKWLIMFFLASVLIFWIVRMMPVTPAEMWLGAYNLPLTEENIAYITEKMGLDGPLILQYFAWMKSFLAGDWGYSLVSHVSIREQFAEKLPLSLSIGLCGDLIGMAAAFFLGYRAAYRRQGFCDKLTKFLAVLSQAVPTFLLSILIIQIFGVKFKIVKFFTGGEAASLTAAILLTALSCTGVLARVVRNAFREEMQQSYVKFAVSMGFPRKQILLRQAVRPVLCKLIAAVMSGFAWVFGGSTVLEFAFGIPGISYFLVDSMKDRDYTVLQTYILVVVIWMFLVHLVLNLILNRLDVRRRT